MNIVIYARYSSEAQKEDSIIQQVNECKKYAELHGHTVIDEYKDKAESGRTDNRPNLQRMLRDSRSGAFEAVLVWKFDRFSRNMRDALNNEYILEQNGVEIISATEVIPKGAIGIITKAVLLGTNEYYSVDLAEKTSRGTMAIAEECKYTGGVVPLGYKINKEGKYKIDDDTKDLVKKIFSMYANGKTIVGICNYFNDSGLTTTRGNKFKPNSFHTILKNEKYIGIYVYKDVRIEDGVPRIIDDDLFEEVQLKLQENKKLGARERAFEEYILTGKLFCGHCSNSEHDTMMVGHSGYAKGKTKYCYYKCKNGKTCDKKMIGKDYIEEVVIDMCKSILTDKNIENISKAVAELAKNEKANQLLIALEKSLKTKIKEKNNLKIALRECEDSSLRQEIFSDLKQIAPEIEELEKNIAIEKTKVIGVNEDEIRFFLTQFQKYDILNVAHRKEIIKLLVNKIYLYDDKVTITFNSGKDTVDITFEFADKITKIDSKSDLCLLPNSLYQ